MKITILTAIMTVATSLYGIYLAFSFNHYSDDIVVRVLDDHTDFHQAKPETEQILSFFDLETHEWNGANFEITAITDFDYNVKRGANIPSFNCFNKYSERSSYQRTKEIREFGRQVNSAIKLVREDSIGRNHSSVYRSIARELNVLSESKADRKILLAFSDLKEKSDFLDLYNEAYYTLLATHPDSILGMFEKQALLKDLSGVEVYLIYQPLNYTDNESFKLISQLYRQMLEAHVAKVTITSNLVL